MFTLFFNTSSLKLFQTNDIPCRLQPPPPPSPVTDLDGHERFIVECILSDRMDRGKRQYLVKWVGYSDPTWEPAEFLLDEAGNPIRPLQSYCQQVHTILFWEEGWHSVAVSV